MRNFDLHIITGSTAFRKRLTFMSLLAICSLCCQSCFTGIEGTKKITISKEDKRLLTPKPEELILSDIKGQNIKEWIPGKKFLLTDQRAEYIIAPMNGAPAVSNLVGDTIVFKDTYDIKGFDGSDDTHIIFSKGDDLYDYSPRLGGLKQTADITSDRLPMLIDLDMIDQANSILSGMTVYPLSINWLDSDSSLSHGCRYLKANIVSVTPGNQINPMLVEFYVPSENATGYYLMNFDNRDSNAKTFPSLFSLTDPRKQNSNISAENWDKICHAVIALGMTKNECRLALGPPEDVTSTRDYSSTIDVWRYADGTVLFFRDGVLTKANGTSLQNSSL